MHLSPSSWLKVLRNPMPVSEKATSNAAALRLATEVHHLIFNVKDSIRSNSLALSGLLYELGVFTDLFHDEDDRDGTLSKLIDMYELRFRLVKTAEPCVKAPGIFDDGSFETLMMRVPMPEEINHIVVKDTAANLSSLSLGLEEMAEQIRQVKAPDLTGFRHEVSQIAPVGKLDLIVRISQAKSDITRSWRLLGLASAAAQCLMLMTAYNLHLEKDNCRRQYAAVTTLKSSGNSQVTTVRVSRLSGF